MITNHRLSYSIYCHSVIFYLNFTCLLEIPELENNESDCPLRRCDSMVCKGGRGPGRHPREVFGISSGVDDFRSNVFAGYVPRHAGPRKTLQFQVSIKRGGRGRYRTLGLPLHKKGGRDEFTTNNSGPIPLARIIGAMGLAQGGDHGSGGPPHAGALSETLAAVFARIARGRRVRGF
jgi:hypothetical protein